MGESSSIAESSLGYMPTSFAKFLGKFTPLSGKALPLVHCQTAKDALQIFADRRLKPTLCDVYQTNLLYLFYGRPAYKPAEGTDANAIVDLAPVCLVLDPAVLSNAIRILPFDSGGFERYQAAIGSKFELAEFELGKSKSIPARLVQAFYKTNSNYYEQRPTLGEADLNFSELTPRAYARLIADKSVRKVDDRCGTIEIQFNSEILLKKALRAVVGPTPVVTDPEVERALKDCPSVTVYPYKTYGRTEPTAFSHAIYSNVEDFLTRIGCLP